MTENTSTNAEQVPPPKTALGADVSTELEQNILDSYENPTYHFRLYLLSPGAVSAREFGNNANAERVVIAESGVSPVEIDDVQITTTGSISKEAGTGVATRFSFTLREPFGVTLIDQIQRASYFLKIDNFQKFPWYLELSFKGRRHPEIDDNAGSPDDSDAPLKNLVWLWPIQLVNMAMNVTTGGTVYAMEATPYSEHAYTNESSDLEEQISITTDTVGDFFTQLQEQLNTRETDKSDTSGYIETDSYLFYVDQDVYNEKIVPETVEERQNRAGSYKVEDNDKMTFSFQAGTSIDKIVRNVLSLTARFQKEVKATTDPDSPGEDKKGEEAIYQNLWRVIADTDVGAYDSNRNDYRRTFKYLIIPYQMTSVQTPSNITANVTDQARVDSHRRKGIIKKLYNYVYTGLNDQVFDFELNFNFNWYVALPIQGGLTTIASKKEPAAKVTEEQKDKSEKYAKKVDDFAQFLADPTGFAPLSELENLLNGSVNSLTDYLEPATNAIDSASITVNDVIGNANADAQAALDTVQSGMPQVPAPIAGVVQNPAVPFISGASTLLNQLTDATRIPRISSDANDNTTDKAQKDLRSIDKQLDAPEVVEAANQKIKATIQEAQSGKESSDGQDFAASPGQTLLSAMFEQAESPVSRDLINIDLNVKGDPYWLEPSPIRMGSAPSSQFRRSLLVRGVNPDATQDAEASDVPPTEELNETSVANTAEQETLIVFRSFTPQEFDPETGITPAGKKASNVLNGVYAVKTVQHSFAGGEFTQRLMGVRDINTNLSNVDLFEELRDKPEDTATNNVGPRSDTESSTSAQGAIPAAPTVDDTVAQAAAAVRPNPVGTGGPRVGPTVEAAANLEPNQGDGG